MFIDKFLSLCESRGIKPDSKFMQKLGISSSTKTNWVQSKENGIEVLPSTSNLISICKYFNVSADFLLDIDSKQDFVYPEEISLLNNYRKLSSTGKMYAIDRVQKIVDMEAAALTPTIEIKHSIFKVSAGYGVNIWESNAFETITIERTFYSAKADYCLTISGDSMQPDYNDGDIVLVKAQPDIEIGQVGIFTQGDKGYIKEKGRNRLISLNPEYPDIIPSEYDDIVCRGLVIGKV